MSDFTDLLIKKSSKPITEDLVSKYAFIVDTPDLEQTISACGAQAIAIDRDITAEDVAHAIKDNYLFGDRTVVPCLRKKLNEAILDILEGCCGGLLDDGWQIFYGKPYLRRIEHFEKLQQAIRDYVNQHEGNAPQGKIKALSLVDFEAKEPEWLISGYIPRYQITVVSGEGGVGKTSLWADIVAGISTGKATILDRAIGIPEDFKREPAKVLFLSGEDSVKYVLKKRLTTAGADVANVYSVPIENEGFHDLQFGSKALEDLIAETRPALVVFDPLQAFVDGNIKMGDRNAMRQALAPMIGLGEKYGVTTLIIMHANKQAGAYGRRRMADSSDVWDIARSVLMAGSTQERGTFYLTQEKSNYGQTQKTVLYRINENGKIKYQGVTDKKDRDFVSDDAHASRMAPERSECMEQILSMLSEADGHQLEAKVLEAELTDAGYKEKTIRNAKAELKTAGKITVKNTGFKETKKYWIALT